MELLRRGLAYQEGGAWHVISGGDRLHQDGCQALAVDRLGGVWYGSKKAGAFSIIKNPLSTTPVTQRFEEGVGTAAFFLDSDRRSWLWRGDADGIYVADPEQARRGEWLRLSERDGLPDANTNLRSFFEDADGSIWFGAEGTLIHFDPATDLVRPRYSPSVFISSFSLDGGEAEMADAIQRIKNGSYLSAHVGVVQFDRPNALRFRYRLLPTQTAWSPGNGALSRNHRRRPL